MESSKPRKQRFMRYNAEMHLRQKFAHAHVSKELRAKLSIKKKSMQVSAGDTVKIMAGGNAGKSGKVNRVDLKKSKLFIEGVSRKTSKGKETMLPISISNTYITDLNLNDKLRKAKLGIA